MSDICEQRGTDRSLLVRTLESVSIENEKMRGEIVALRECIGLFSTVKPDMEMDADNPLNMAHQVVNYCAALREENEGLRDGVAVAISIARSNEADAQHRRTAEAAAAKVRAFTIPKYWAGELMDRLADEILAAPRPEQP